MSDDAILRISLTIYCILSIVFVVPLAIMITEMRS